MVRQEPHPSGEPAHTSPSDARDLLWEPPPVPAADLTPRTDWVVFAVAAVLTLAFVLWGAFAGGSLGAISDTLLGGLLHYGGWGFVLSASTFVVIALWLAFSKYGRITLGRDDEEPEYNTVSWISMLFATGMGIGMMFYGVAEPLTHYVSPPPGTGGGSGEQQAMTAMATTLFHWSLHPWAIYAVVGLAIAYGTYRRGRRQLISAAFIPLIGEKAADGPVGKLIDVLAIFATLFGSACSLGLGALQIAGGFQILGWVELATTGLLVGIIAALMACFLLSALSGVSKGIQWLSNINMVMAALLMVFILAVGPTVYILDLIPGTVGSYFQDFFSMAGRTDAAGGERTATWLATWTVFYWAWWISWTPFVGLFIGKISRGRTIRQFVAGVILVPSVVSLVWFTVLGGTAIDLQASGVDLASQGGIEEQLYGLLANFPWATAVSVLAALLVAIFFVTGADSASIVMGTLSQRGANDPRRPMTAFWGVLIAAVAAIMLVVGQGEGNALEGLQRITILVAAPWTIVMLLLCLSLLRDLRNDPLIMRSHKAREVVAAAVVTGAQVYDGEFRIDVSAADEKGSRRVGVEPVRGSRRAPNSEGDEGSGDGRTSRP
ncbi:BCCT family transporter [Actinorugispora endophytica]|uniref:Choline/carnitine/betaine transport n=1 Tax=Actinorugispora endophytica TaxID=1605990 RepID=A0A4R6V4A7_9ACTN|nr:BCCT family transporter [Actinorugispora endophytica]TDQ55245.1 choline/carnitine/betaine transport [Actinorugispora endophytica]